MEVPCFEVREPGDVLKGYAILLAGCWDGWVYIPESPGRRLVIASMGLSKDDTIDAVIRKAREISQ